MSRFGIWAVLALLAFVLAGQVFGFFGDPPIGLANNGDYGKIIGPHSLGSPSRFEYRYAPLHYQFAPEYFQRPGYLSSEQILAYIPVRLGKLIFPPDRFEMRLAGAFQGLLYLAIVAYAVCAFARIEAMRRIGVAIPCAALLVLILGDASTEVVEVVGIECCGVCRISLIQSGSRGCPVAILN